MKPGDHGSTYGGNPMAGQACRTVFKIIEEEKLLDHVQEISKYLHEQLDKLVAKYDFIKEKRGLGLMIGLEFDHPVKPYIQKMLDKGLIMVTAGTNVIRMLPPFIINKDDVDKMINILTETIDEINA
ncbi:aminotransferase class III-fold pyridoxal phosphate-dependent enzyme [Coprobacillaceae bacterium CR2/5/TPMF4]|nr:aminotransferase class III-fold pyridoxal phosphate-dependent enzyme [Coprobacillaceae bacterium CR2/5/TPMF4]